jgi:putative DNA primase/helicase
MNDELDPLFEQLELTDEEIRDCQPLNTDAANADVFVKRYGESFRYVPQWARWLAWDSTRWVVDESEDLPLEKAIYSARASYTEALGRLKFFEDGRDAVLAKRGGRSDESDKLDAQIKNQLKICGWYLTSQGSSKLHSCLTCARPKIHTPLRTLDADPWLFNVLNGTLDLRTGELKPHDRDQRITQISPIEWDDRAKSPTWDRFISEVMSGDAELEMYVRRVVGYCMTALTTEHALFFLFGVGSNGKSTFTRTIQDMMGEYASPAPRPLLFEQKHGQQHPTELAMLYGQRFVSCAEIGEQMAFDEAKLKDLTGGDPIKVRRMNEDFWTLHPTHKLLISGNHKPRVKGDDQGIWRRLRLIPWKFTPTAPDRELGAKLRAELPGILRWAVNGAEEWARIGLSEPPSVLAATKAYREESNIVAAFLEVCDKGPDMRSTASDLRRAYEQWCKDLGHVPLGAKMFGDRLQREGFEAVRFYVGTRQVRGWKGLSAPDV